MCIYILSTQYKGENIQLKLSLTYIYCSVRFIHSYLMNDLSLQPCFKKWVIFSFYLSLIQHIVIASSPPSTFLVPFFFLPQIYCSFLFIQKRVVPTEISTEPSITRCNKTRKKISQYLPGPVPGPLCTIHAVLVLSWILGDSEQQKRSVSDYSVCSWDPLPLIGFPNPALLLVFLLFNFLSFFPHLSSAVPLLTKINGLLLVNIQILEG